MTAALNRAASRLEEGARDRHWLQDCNHWQRAYADDGDAATTKRRAGLTETLNGIAARLR